MLSLLHYCAAATTALIGSFPLLHVAMGAFLVFMPDAMRGTGRDAFPREAGLFFMAIGLAFVTAGWSIAAAHFLTARFLKRRKYFWFCVAVSLATCFMCMFSSGVVSIASLVVLFRPGVKDLFSREEVTAPATPVPPP